MRVLLCSNFFYRRGGDCTYLFNLADLLHQHGHEVFFFSMHHPKNLPCPQSEYFVDFIDYAELNRRQKTPTTGVRVLARSIYSIQARRRLRALVREIRPDVAHLQNIHAHLTPSILHVFRKLDIPVIWTLHDFKLICPESTFLSNGRICEECKGRRFYRCAVNRCKKNARAPSLVAALEAYIHRLLDIPDMVKTFIAPSRFLRDKFIEFGWDEKQIVFVRNFLTSLPEGNIPGEGYGLYLGQLSAIKGLPVLLQALSRNPEIAFHIAGEGPERSRLEQLAGELDLRNMRFTGHLSGSDLEREIGRADYGVTPSVCYENCPYSVMELMAAGKPVIASRLGGLVELVGEDARGMLFRPGDSVELAAKLLRVSTDRTVCRTQGEAAKVFAKQEFSGDKHYTRLMEVYSS